MLFVRLAIFLSALVFSTADSWAKCEQLKVADNLMKGEQRGWQVVRVFLLYDWKQRDVHGPVTYPLTIEMERPTRARVNSEFWVRLMYACTDVQATSAKPKKKEWLQYYIRAWPGEQAGTSKNWAYFQTPLLLPADVVSRRATANALIAGVEYPGRWVRYKGRTFLVLEPPKKKEGSN